MLDKQGGILKTIPASSLDQCSSFLWKGNFLEVPRLIRKGELRGYPEEDKSAGLRKKRKHRVLVP